jgi:hypothetical protein
MHVLLIRDLTIVCDLDHLDDLDRSKHMNGKGGDCVEVGSLCRNIK